jgi:hypothetical protein
LAGEGRAHQLGNSWTGQVAAAGDAAPAIPGAYWGCRFYVLGGCRLPSTFVYDPLLQRTDTDLLAALHYDYTLPRASSGTLPGTTASSRTTQARKVGRNGPPIRECRPRQPRRQAASGMQRTDAVQGL